jgi:hypothetical protein
MRRYFFQAERLVSIRRRRTTHASAVKRGEIMHPTFRFPTSVAKIRNRLIVVIVRGKLVSRGKGKRADYVLYYKPNIPLALIEAKDNSYGVGGRDAAGARKAVFRVHRAHRLEQSVSDFGLSRNQHRLLSVSRR